MNNLRRCCLAITMFSAAAYCQAEPLRMVTHHLPPYQVLEGERLSGSAIDLIQCILTEMGQAYQVDVRPLARAKKEFTDGKFDGVFVLDQVNQTDNFGVASEPLLLTQRNLYTLNSLTLSIDSPEMKALQIGVLHGSTLQKWLLKNGYSNIQTRYDYHVLFELLQRGRLGAVFAPTEVYLNEMDHGHINKELKVKTISEVKIVSFFSFNWLKKHPQFLPKFNAALARCK
ncbi:substrate-binding periplasmic protein [Agarivorans sp. MS3-6]